MLTYLSHAYVALSLWESFSATISDDYLTCYIHPSHINFLFSSQMVITTREEQIKCSVGYELGGTTYSRGHHENFHGEDTPWTWLWIFMSIGICGEWDEVEHPRNRKYRTCLGESQRFCHIKYMKEKYTLIFMSMGSTVKCLGFEFQLDCLLGMCPWLSHLTFKNSMFFICNMRIATTAFQGPA